MHNTKESLQFEDIPAAMSIVLENLKQIKEEISKMKKSKTENKGNTHIPIGIERVSDLTGKAVTTLYRYTANGLIPCYKKGKAILFFEDEIIEWIKNGKCESVEEKAEAYNSNIVPLAKRKRY